MPRRVASNGRATAVGEGCSEIWSLGPGARATRGEGRRIRTNGGLAASLQVGRHCPGRVANGRGPKLRAAFGGLAERCQLKL